LLCISEKTVRRLIASGALVAHRAGRNIRISDADLRAFLAQRRG
jgi:excisionase family DNA binding protein